MNAPAAPWADAATLEQIFADGLARMLAAHDDLGVYILCLANAAIDPALWTALRPALAERHARLAHGVTAALREGRPLTAPEDDQLVFLKLMALGFDAVRPAESRQVGPWRVDFNPIRALRPPRASHEAFAGLRRDFNARGFHFNKPFLAREVMWQGELAGRPARLLYNKFPFAPRHGLLLPEPLAERPQWLTPELHDWAWQVARDCPVAGFGLAYNSLGGMASVNHLHFQSFTGADELAVTRPEYAHNGGASGYPLGCLRMADVSQAWLEIDALHQAGQPYNLIYRCDRLYILPRQPQGAVPLPAWSAGMGWSDLAGRFTVFSRADFEGLDAAQIEAALTAQATSQSPGRPKIDVAPPGGGSGVASRGSTPPDPR